MSAWDPVLEIVVRLIVATFAGGLIGWQRSHENKRIGVRTMGLVALAAATMAIAVQASPTSIIDVQAASRVAQGVMTGIGFLCAGVILHGRRDDRVHGLTTAAAVWMTAVLGFASGVGAYVLVLVATLCAFILLSVSKAIDEKR